MDCKNSFSSSTILYGSKKSNEFIFGCLGDDKDVVFIKFSKNFEIVSTTPRNQYRFHKTQNNGFILSILKLQNNDSYSIFVSSPNENFIFKDDLPEYLKPEEVHINENTNIDKILNNSISDITYKNKYSTVIFNSKEISIVFDERTNNLKKETSQNIITEYISQKIKRSYTEKYITYNNNENVTEINSNQKNSVTTDEIKENIKIF